MGATVVTKIYDGRVTVTLLKSRHTYSVRVQGLVDKLWQPSVTGIVGVRAKGALTNWAAKKSLEYVAKKLGEFESKQGAPPFTVDTREIHDWLAEAADGWNDGKEATIGTLAHSFFQAEVMYRAGLGEKPRIPIYDPVTLPEFTESMIDSAIQSINAGITFLDEHRVKPLLLERALWSPTTGVIGTTDFIGEIDDELCVADWKTSKRIYPEYRIQLAKYTQMYYEEFGKLPKVRWAINTKKDGGLEHEKYMLDSYQSDLDAFDDCQGLYNWNRMCDPYSAGTPVTVLGAF